MPMPTRDSERLFSQGTLQQVQSIDYMVLDLNAVKQELMDTQNQFSMTQNTLNAERLEKQEIMNRLEEAQGRIVELEHINSRNTQGSATVVNPWQQTTQRSDPSDIEYKVNLVQERDRLLDQKSELQD